MNLRHALLPVALILALPTLAHAARGFEVRDLATLDRHSSPTLSPGCLRIFQTDPVISDLISLRAIFFFPGAARRLKAEHGVSGVEECL